MFTGLVEAIGTVLTVENDAEGAAIELATDLSAGLERGASIAVNGACLTATTVNGDSLRVEVMNESLRRSTLGSLEVGSRVNLELPLAVGDRLDGHIVQGHIDAVAKLSGVVEAGFSRVLRCELPSELARYVVRKGSIAIDGVSLTVSDLGDDWIEVSLIPETLERTTLGDLQANSLVNIEVDVLAKHVERLLTNESQPS